jgi:hypothetical protein
MRRNERCSPRQDVNVTFSDSAQNYSFTFYIFLSQYLHIRLYATHFTGSRGVLRADPVFEQLGQGAQTEPTIDILAQMH